MLLNRVLYIHGNLNSVFGRHVEQYLYKICICRLSNFITRLSFQIPRQLPVHMITNKVHENASSAIMNASMEREREREERSDERREREEIEKR